MYENVFKRKVFFVFILILKFDFSSIWVLSFSCSYEKDINAHKKMYENSWEIVSKMRQHTQDGHKRIRKQLTKKDTK